MPDLPDVSKTELAIIELTNDFRRSEKLNPAKPNAQLTGTARQFAEFLARTGRFAHEADGRQPSDRARAAGYQFCMISENLALNLDSRGFTTKGLANQAVQGWKNSPGHRRNMVEPNVTETGVGVARASAEASPKYLSVQLFGRPDTLKFSFQVTNRSDSAVTYALGAKPHHIDPNVTTTHTVCKASDIVFERAGNWLGGTKLDTRFAPTNGASFVLKASAAGKIVVEVGRAAPRLPSQP